TFSSSQASSSCLSASIFGWFCASVSTNGPCPAASSAEPPTPMSTPLSPKKLAYHSSRMLPGRTPSLRRRSCLPSLPVPSSSVPSAPPASLIQPSSKQRLNPTSPSSGSLLSSPTFHRILKPRSSSSLLS